MVQLRSTSLTTTLLVCLLTGCGGGGEEAALDPVTAPVVRTTPGGQTVTVAAPASALPRPTTAPSARATTTGSAVRAPAPGASAPTEGASSAASPPAPPPSRDTQRPGRPEGREPAPLDRPVAPRRSGQRREVVQVVRDYRRALVRGDGRTACDKLTVPAARDIVRRLRAVVPETSTAPCEQAIVLYQGAYGRALRSTRVSAVRIAGARASAVVPPGSTVRLQRVNERWRISAYEGQ